MKKRVRVRHLLLFFVLAYGAFVYLYGDYRHSQILQAMHSHAIVVENDVWTLSPETSGAYLSLAAARDNYKEIAVRDVSGQDLVTFTGPELTGLDGLLDSAGLFPKALVSAQIRHQGEVIALLVAEHRNTNLYVFFWAGVIFGLVFLTISLFLKTVQAKHEIENRVLERTAQLRSEIDKRSQVAEALRKSEERFQYAMQATKDGLWDWDVPSDKMYFSPGYYSILGFEPDDSAMTSQGWRERIHPEDRSQALRAYDDCIENRKEGFEVEFRMKTQAGGWKWILCRGRAVDRDPSQRATRLVGTHVDITDRKLAEQERRKLESQLQRSEKMELVGTLASGVAHDLNNVLGAIVGYPDLLISGMEEGDPMRGHLLTIKESGERAALIVQDLLTLARRGVPVTEPENLNSIIQAYIESQEFSKLKQLYPKVFVETKLAAELFNVVGSRVHLSKAVMNLCSNALESMPAGGMLIISTENVYLDRPVRGHDSVQEGNYVQLTIHDEGVGIGENDLKRIFEPFYTKKVMGKSGTGLGMAVVWGAVKDHNGYIEVMSQEGVGTTFHVYFPATSRAVSERDAPVPIEKFVGNQETILVVDDVAEQRAMAVNMLRRLNYSVTSVHSGEEALEYLKHREADLLVLDMIMDPGIDGLETYRRIVRIRPNQRAIIASGYSETQRVMEAQKLGAGQYVKKPYTLERLGQAVKHELTRRAGEALRLSG